MSLKTYLLNDFNLLNDDFSKSYPVLNLYPENRLSFLFMLKEHKLSTELDNNKTTKQFRFEVNKINGYYLKHSSNRNRKNKIDVRCNWLGNL